MPVAEEFVSGALYRKRLAATSGATAESDFAIAMLALLFSSPWVVTLASILTTSRLADQIDFDYFFVAFDEIETTFF